MPSSNEDLYNAQNNIQKNNPLLNLAYFDNKFGQIDQIKSFNEN